MKELPLLRFIPFRRSDIVDMCLAEGTLAEVGRGRFQAAYECIEAHFQEVFHQLRKQLKDAYSPLDPDADTRLVCNPVAMSAGF